MHRHTDSTSSASRIWTNPLNIRGLDGSDLIVASGIPRQAVPVHKPRYERSPDRNAVSAELCSDTLHKKLEYTETFSELTTSATSDSRQLTASQLGKSVKEEHMQLLEENLAESQARKAQRTVGVSSEPQPSLNYDKQIANLGIPLSPNDPFEPLLKIDIGSTDPLSLSLGSFSLTRKSTITSRCGDTSAGPSRSPALVQRLRSIRGSEKSSASPESSLSSGDRALLERATSKRMISNESLSLTEDALPEDILKLIGMSTSVEWPEAAELDEIESVDSSKHIGLKEPKVSGSAASTSTMQEEPCKDGPLVPEKPKFDVEKEVELPEPTQVSSRRPKSMPSISTFSSRTEKVPDNHFGNEKRTEFNFKRESMPPLSTSALAKPVSGDQERHPTQKSNDVLTPVPELVPTVAELDPVLSDDRGRLFLCVDKLTNIRNLPLDSQRNPRFSITLDNGTQAVTTPPVALTPSANCTANTARISQEFELVVGKDLELVITIQLSMDALQPPLRPRSMQTEAVPTMSHATGTPPSSPSNTDALVGTTSRGDQNTPPILPRSPKKLSAVREFLSPRRRKERHAAEIAAEQARELAQQENESYEQSLKLHQQRESIWRDLVGPLGEFARGYLFESHYERDIFGRAQKFHVPLYSEWAREHPDHVADLQITMMYIPKFYGSEQIPGSLMQCQAALREAASIRNRRYEGFLSQNGGDCVMWRRRWFSTHRNELRGYHEQSRKLRTVIHLENMAQVIDAEDICGDDDTCFIFRDRSFRVVFNDGEQVNFYADSVEYKRQWMAALSCSAAVGGRHRCWTDVVLDRREYEAGLVRK